MIFNADLFDIIAEAHFGLTVPNTIINSALYKYFTSPKSPQYNEQKLRPMDFLTIAVHDDLFLEYACMSIDTAIWLREAYYNNVKECPDDIMPWERMQFRTSLYVSNMGVSPDYYDDGELSMMMVRNIAMADIFYSFVTMKQLEFIHATSPKSMPLNNEIIVKNIDRLDVMMFLKQRYPAAFAALRKKPAKLTDAIHNNRYTDRPLETFEWLVANKYVKPIIGDIYDECWLIGSVEYLDDSIIQWLLTHHTFGVIERYHEYRSEYENNYALDWVLAIFERCNTATLKLYLETVDNVLPKKLLGKKMVANANFLHSYILENEIGV